MITVHGNSEVRMQHMDLLLHGWNFTLDLIISAGAAGVKLQLISKK